MHIETIWKAESQRFYSLYNIERRSLGTGSINELLYCVPAYNSLEPEFR